MRRAALLAVLLLVSCGPSPSPVASPSPSAVPASMLNPDVTQATIGQTICVSGWTATVRPPASYTDALKVKQLAGYADQNPSHYEEDHHVPLELGGAPRDPSNLWPELRVAYGGDAETKDKAENAGKAAVCSGRETLAAAQLAMFTQWGPKS